MPPIPTASRKLTRKGAAAVEFAVVAPVFLLLLAGILEFGQAFRVQHSLSTLARQGARMAILEGATNSKVDEKLKARCKSALAIDPDHVTVAIAVNGSEKTSLSAAQAGDEIRVTVSVPFSQACVGFYANTFAKSTLSSSCILEHE